MFDSTVKEIEQELIENELTLFKFIVPPEDNSTDDNFFFFK